MALVTFIKFYKLIAIKNFENSLEKLLFPNNLKMSNPDFGTSLYFCVNDGDYNRDAERGIEAEMTHPEANEPFSPKVLYKTFSILDNLKKLGIVPNEPKQGVLEIHYIPDNYIECVINKVRTLVSSARIIDPEKASFLLNPANRIGFIPAVDFNMFGRKDPNS